MHTWTDGLVTLVRSSYRLQSSDADIRAELDRVAAHIAPAPVVDPDTLDLTDDARACFLSGEHDWSYPTVAAVTVMFDPDLHAEAAIEHIGDSVAVTFGPAPISLDGWFPLALAMRALVTPQVR